jgi:hypothetical protein
VVDLVRSTYVTSLVLEPQIDSRIQQRQFWL